MSGDLDRDPEMLGVLPGVADRCRGVIGVSEDSREPGRGAGSGSRLVGCRVWAPIWASEMDWAVPILISFFYFLLIKIKSF